MGRPKRWSGGRGVRWRSRECVAVREVVVKEVVVVA